MSRIKRGTTTRAKHKRILDQAKGYRGRRKNTIRVARQAVEKAGQYAYRDRKVKKRTFRALWIQRINAAVRAEGLTYSQFIHGTKLAGIELDRKAMADLAMNEGGVFAAVIAQAKAALRPPDRPNAIQFKKALAPTGAGAFSVWGSRAPSPDPSRRREGERPLPPAGGVGEACCRPCTTPSSLPPRKALAAGAMEQLDQQQAETLGAIAGPPRSKPWRRSACPRWASRAGFPPCSRPWAR
jgi:large subunit ribosomal protein L20